MSPEETLEVRHAASMLLIEYARVVADRDTRIRSALSAGLSKAEIARLTGLSRQHIAQITAGHE